MHMYIYIYMHAHAWRNLYTCISSFIISTFQLRTYVLYYYSPQAIEPCSLKVHLDTVTKCHISIYLLPFAISRLSLSHTYTLSLSLAPSLPIPLSLLWKSAEPTPFINYLYIIFHTILSIPTSWYKYTTCTLHHYGMFRPRWSKQRWKGMHMHRW